MFATPHALIFKQHALLSLPAPQPARSSDQHLSITKPFAASTEKAKSWGRALATRTAELTELRWAGTHRCVKVSLIHLIHSPPRPTNVTLTPHAR
mmetsp:Transcript_25147/g.39490  ORF Transcript_25147/g.39490 Transcript_25147/m.39490 type:complete len:95 (-) Transcript_25147:973-1257(-)